MVLGFIKIVIQRVQRLSTIKGIVKKFNTENALHIKKIKKAYTKVEKVNDQNIIEELLGQDKSSSEQSSAKNSKHKMNRKDSLNKTSKNLKQGDSVVQQNEKRKTKCNASESENDSEYELP